MEDHIYLRLTELMKVTSDTLERLTGIRGKYYKDPKHHVFNSECFIQSINLVARNANESWGTLQKELKFYLNNINPPQLPPPNDIEPPPNDFPDDQEFPLDDEENYMDKVIADKTPPPIPPSASTSIKQSPSFGRRTFSINDLPQQQQKRKHKCCCKFAKKSKIDDYFMNIPGIIIHDSDDSD